MNTALILFAHGARDPEWANPIKQVRAAILQRHPSAKVELAFLEFMAPSLTESIETLRLAGYEKLVILPMFIAQGGHLKRDVPALLDEIRSTGKNIEIYLLPPIGENDAVIQAMAASAIADAGL